MVSQDTNILTQNRAFLYGDAVLKRLKLNSKILF
jgi:branched-chain amino acid aminotransferase